MTDIVKISNFALSLNVSDPTFSGPQSLLNILSKLNFTSVSEVSIKEGAYTPNNDYLYLLQAPPAKAPNFVLVQSPVQINLTVTLTGIGPIVNNVPANKLFLLLLPPGTTIDSVYVEGRTTGPTQMPQGIEAQYFFLSAQCVF